MVAIVGRHVDGLDGGPAAAQCQPDLAGQHHDAATPRQQQPAGEQLLGRARRVLGQHGLAGGAGRGLAAGLEDVLEQRTGRGRELVEVLLDPVRRSAGSEETVRSPLIPGPRLPSVTAPVKASVTGLSGRIPWGVCHARARSRTRVNAAVTALWSARSTAHSPDSLVWPRTTRASRTQSSNRVRWSSARNTEVLVAARDANWAES